MEKITVIMPVWNAENTLDEAIQSIVDQSYTNWELIAIDDASTDSSLSILKSWSEKDHRIIIIQNEKNLGVAATLNRGLDLATGRWIARMDSDDISREDRFTKQVEYLQNHPEVGLCGSWVEFFGDKTGIRKMITEFDEITVELLFSFPLEHPTWMIRGETVERNHLRYDPSYQCEDLDLSVRIALIQKIINYPEPLLKLRQHKGRISRIRKEAITKGIRRVLQGQLIQLGIHANEDQIQDHLRIRGDEPITRKRDLWRIQNWMQYLIQENNRSEIYAKDLFKLYLSKKWRSLCGTQMGKLSGVGWLYFFSPISKISTNKINHRWRICRELNHSIPHEGTKGHE